MSGLPDDEILEPLESSLATEALTAQLAEWSTENMHKVASLSAVLRVWRTMMEVHEFNADQINMTLVPMIERLWPLPPVT
jgi:hypothetical protein